MYLLIVEHYLLKNDEEKYDVVPEIWEGHNIADFVASNVKDMLESIRDEEEAKIQAGYEIFSTYRGIYIYFNRT